MKVKALCSALFAAASMVVLASCGAILEEATERAVEQGLEEGGIEVDLDDIEDGEFNVTVTDENGEEATLEINGEDGVVEFESEDGEGELGIGAGLADGWPDEYPLPDGLTIQSSLAFDEDGQQTFQAIFTGPVGSLDSYYAHFQGFDLPIFGESTASTGDGEQRTINWGTDDEQTGTLFLTEGPDELFGQVTLVIKN